MIASRPFQFLIVLAVALIFVCALCLEHFMGLRACPLCIFQRIAYAGIALGALISGVFYSCRHARITGWVIGLIFSLSGLGLALRQCWLQHLGPAAMKTCLPGLDYMYSTFSWFKATMLVFQGTSDCAAVTWRFLGLSIAGWSVICFAVFVILFIRCLKRNPKSIVSSPATKD